MVQITNWIRPYAGWTALVLLVAALFDSLIATKAAFPLILLIAAAALAVVHFWYQLKTFDFWAVDEWARMRYEAFSVPDWHAPHHAAELFCSQVVVKTRDEAAAEMNTLMMELIRGNDHGPAGGDDNRKERNAKYDAAQVRYAQCNTSLSRELLSYLVRGYLLAKGLPTQDNVALSEHIIPTSRWRVMTLDIAKAQATGLGWHYEGLVVGVKPRPRKPADPASSKPQSEQPSPPTRSGNPAVRAPQPPRPEQPRPPTRSA